MRIGTLGINHKSADLRLRERLAKECERLFHPAHSLHFDFSYVLLSTCNRSEVYFFSEDPAETHTYLLNALRTEMEEEFEHRIYSYFGSDCFFHLARVTAGVDSALIGETEIQGQVKRAYELAVRYKPLAPELHFLFQKCLKIGKEIRTKSLFSNLPTLEEAIWMAGKRILGELTEKSILFVGLSEINHKILMRFKENGCRHLFLCNRTNEKAIEVGKKMGIHSLPWEELPRWSSFDASIFGTKCNDFIAERKDFHPRSTCKLVIDLGVPRNVDPRLSRFSTLLNVDQINSAVDRKRRVKAAEIARLETQLIAQAVEKQLAIYKLKELQRSSFFSQAI